MKYQIIPVTAFQQNCSLIFCEQTKQAAVIDPGGDIELIIQAIQNQQVVVQSILLTHGHMDHVGATQQLAAHLKVPVLGPHPNDRFWLDMLDQQSQAFGFPPTPPFLPDRWLSDGERLQLGEQSLQVIHCPGHTPRHVVFFCQTAGLAWVGDVLFKHSIGRTDFPQGHHQTLIDSIQNKLWPLGANVRFIPGHGPESTFGEEMKHNPYVGKHATMGT